MWAIRRKRSPPLVLFLENGVPGNAQTSLASQIRAAFCVFPAVFLSTPAYSTVNKVAYRRVRLSQSARLSSNPTRFYNEQFNEREKQLKK